MPPGICHRANYNNTQAISFISVYAKRRLPPFFSAPPPHTRVKKKNQPISNSAMYLAHNHRKRAELLTSLAAYPDPESTLKRMNGTGFPSLPVSR